MSSTRPPELSALGRRVTVRTVREEDVEPYRRAVLASAARMRRWNPVDPHDLPHQIAMQSADRRTFFVVANEPEGDHRMVGRINLNGVVRGRFRSVSVGYDAYDPYVGRGLFGEGLRLVVGLALAPVDEGGMGLHRVEASVQPGNTRSAGLLRSLGFRHEGSSPRLLLLPDDNGVERWRDHERFAVTREEWPRAAYAPAPTRRIVVLADTGGTEAGWEVARGVAVELALPLFDIALGHRIDLAAVVADSTPGAVVAGAVRGGDLVDVMSTLRSAASAPVEIDLSTLSSPVSRALIVEQALLVRAAGQ